MKPRRLSGMCGGPYSVDARSRSSPCVTHLSPPAFSALLPVTLLTSKTHPGPRARAYHAHLYPCPSQSFFITQSTRNGHITSFASCLLLRPCPSQWGFHHDKGRDATIWVLSIPWTVSPAPLHLRGAQPVPCSCPHVGKARRITNPECSRSLEKECAVLNNYRCCCVKRVCMEERHSARYAPTEESSKVSLGHWLWGSNQSREDSMWTTALPGQPARGLYTPSFYPYTRL